VSTLAASDCLHYPTYDGAVTPTTLFLHREQSSTVSRLLFFKQNYTKFNMQKKAGTLSPGMHKSQAEQVSMATNYCSVTPNIHGSWVWNLLFKVTFLAPGILRWILGFCFGKFMQPCSIPQYKNSWLGELLKRSFFTYPQMLGLVIFLRCTLRWNRLHCLPY
jgi:hypothetical protein